MVNTASVRNKIPTFCQSQFPKTEGLIVVVGAARGVGVGVGILDTGLVDFALKR